MASADEIVALYMYTVEPVVLRTMTPSLPPR